MLCVSMELRSSSPIEEPVAPSTFTGRPSASEADVRARRVRALARLDARRREDEERAARRRAMMRHPAGGRSRGLVAGRAAVPDPDRHLEVVMLAPVR
jgi:hypothetical protein